MSVKYALKRPEQVDNMIQEGHLPWLDNPQEHARLISEFITKRTPAPRKTVTPQVKEDSVAGQ